jgi:hypothetical protein
MSGLIQSGSGFLHDGTFFGFDIADGPSHAVAVFMVKNADGSITIVKELRGKEAERFAIGTQKVAGCEP